MSRQLSELETILQHMIAEHHKMLSYVEKHEAAMKAMDLRAMDAAARLQEASRTRIGLLEQHRRGVAMQLARAMNQAGDVTIRRLAELYPARSEPLLKLRAELKAVVEQVSTRTHITGKVAAAVLGHLNTIVRLVAGAVEKAGLYNKHGVPQVSNRIGVMEAVG